MDLRHASRTIHEQLAAGAAVGDEDVRRAAGLLAVTVEPAVRLALQDVVGALAAEISRELAPGRVDLALRGSEVEVRVVAPSVPAAPAAPAPPVPPPAPEAEEDGQSARVSFRPPQHLKVRLEEAAQREGLSLNAYLIRALSAHLDGAAPPYPAAPPQDPHGTGRTSGWFI